MIDLRELGALGVVRGGMTWCLLLALRLWYNVVLLPDVEEGSIRVMNEGIDRCPLS